MKKIKVILIATAGVFFFYAASAQVSEDTIVKHVNQLVNDAVSKGIFSGDVIITKDGKPFYKKQSGYADWRTKRPINDRTRYNIGSLTKQFTEEMVHQLVKEGKLDYNAPLSKYFDLFPAEIGDKITILQLLTMRSGLGDYFGSREFHEIEETDFKLSDILAIIKKQPLLFEPGTGQRYSNSGYAVLGAVIEKVTGKSYEENLMERIAAPLKMKNMYYTKAEKSTQTDRAFGHVINVEGNKIAMDDISNSHPDGGIYTTANDLLTFTEAKRTHILPSGYNYQPATYVGGTPPWNALISFGNNGISYVITCNIGESADQMGTRIGAIINGKKYPPLTYPVQVTLYKMITEKGMDYLAQN